MGDPYLVICPTYLKFPQLPLQCRESRHNWGPVAAPGSLIAIFDNFFPLQHPHHSPKWPSRGLHTLGPSNQSLQAVSFLLVGQ